jgi:hypothetical protein
VAAVLLVLSFLLPAVENTPGYEAFWISLRSWGNPGEWELSALPLIFSWLANVGAVAGLARLFRPGAARGLAWLSPLCLLSLGPLFVARADLEIGYYVWAVATLLVAALALLARPPEAASERAS